MDTVHGRMTVIGDGGANGKPKPAILSMAEKIQIARAEIDALKNRSAKLGGEEEEYAKLCAEKNAEHARLEQEEAETLKQRAEIIEAEVRASAPAGVEIMALASRAAEKACGHGVIVVRGETEERAVCALSHSSKIEVTGDGAAAVARVDAAGTSGLTTAKLLTTLLKCTLYPDAAAVEKIITGGGHGLAFRAYEAVGMLTRQGVETVAGKSKS